MTNQTFYLPRFMRYVRAQLNEKKRSYFWHFAISCMIYFLVLMMVVSVNTNSRTLYNYELQWFLYYAGLFTTGAVFGLRYFSELARGESALLNLMQPVSGFEKWLLAALIIIVAYPLMYTACFAVMTIPLLVGDSEPLFIPFRQDVIQQLPLWLFYVGMVGYALTTSVMFKRLPIIKSIALGFALFLFFMFIAALSNPDDGVVMFFFEQDVEASTRVLVAGVMIWILPNVLMWFASFRALVERDL